MFDEETGLFSVSGCDQNDKHALRWCVAKQDKRKSRRMRCPDFTNSLYEHFGWDKKCRYKFLGYLIPYEGKDETCILTITPICVYNELAHK